jgi:hypothetical protein
MPSTPQNRISEEIFAEIFRVNSELLGLFENDTFRHGQTLPSESKLIQLLNTESRILQSALRQLVEEKLLTRIPNRNEYRFTGIAALDPGMPPGLARITKEVWRKVESKEWSLKDVTIDNVKVMIGQHPAADYLAKNVYDQFRSAVEVYGLPKSSFNTRGRKRKMQKEVI